MAGSRAARRTIALVAAVVAGFAVPEAALGEQRLQVSPTVMRLSADAGETLTETIAVTAVEDPLVVELQHADFGFDDASYDLTLIRDDAPETTSFSTRGWFSLPKERYQIPSGRTVELPLRIEVPKNTPAGTYLGAALMRVVPREAAAGQSQVQAVAETGPLLFIAVEGGDPPRARLREFDVPSIVRSGPIRPDIVVENRGDEFFTFEGSLSLAGPGRDDRVEIRQQFVVPGQPRRVRTSPDDMGEAGRPELGSRKLGFGRYEVRTRLRIDPTGDTLTATRTVWVVPTWAWILGAVAAVVLAACLALVIAWFLRRRRAIAEELAREERSADAGDVDEVDDLVAGDVGGPLARDEHVEDVVEYEDDPDVDEDSPAWEDDPYVR